MWLMCMFVYVSCKWGRRAYTEETLSVYTERSCMWGGSMHVPVREIFFKKKCFKGLTIFVLKLLPGHDNNLSVFGLPTLALFFCPNLVFILARVLG